MSEEVITNTSSGNYSLSAGGFNSRVFSSSVSQLIITINDGEPSLLSDDVLEMPINIDLTAGDSVRLAITMNG